MIYEFKAIVPNTGYWIVTGTVEADNKQEARLKIEKED